jgi:hypothetical protein
MATGSKSTQEQAPQPPAAPTPTPAPDARPLDETVPGGAYRQQDGTLVNAEGQPIEPTREPSAH